MDAKTINNPIVKLVIKPLLHSARQIAITMDSPSVLFYILCCSFLRAEMSISIFNVLSVHQCVLQAKICILFASVTRITITEG